MADWRQIEDDREKYSAYLCSMEWAELKEAVHKRAHGICEACQTFEIDAVHHLTYERKYHEKPEDLQGNCKHCHNFTHGKSTFDPADRDRMIAWYIKECKRTGRHPAPLHCIDSTSGDYPKWQSIMLAIEQLFSIQTHGKDGYIQELDEAIDLLDSKLPFAYADGLLKNMGSWRFDRYCVALAACGIGLEDALPKDSQNKNTDNTWREF